MRTLAMYMMFCVLATSANIGFQILTIWILADQVALSILVGTAVGLLLKYWLDKRFIFAFETRHLGQDTRLFLLYTLMGVLTTLVFWGIEWLFHVLYQSDAMRYLGGVLGLILGYAIKYALDRRFVFVRSA